MICSQLWTRISPERANEILSSVQSTHKKMYRTMLEVLSPHLKKRVVILLETPKAERHESCRQMLARPQFEPLSVNLFTEWLGTVATPMINAWLDHLGVEHDARGFVKVFPETVPDKKLLKAGMDKLLAAYPDDEVMVYLHVFQQTREIQWEPLMELLAAEVRFPLAPMPEA